MSRSARNSEDEMDLKSGRKNHLTDVVSVDSSLRRSSRIKTVKQTESSPESPSSDTSNVSNTQTKTLRRRAGTMDSTTTKTNRVLRSRLSSISSDVGGEVVEAEAAIGTPTKKGRNNMNSEAVSKTRRSTRLTRAGSEVKSSPMRRVTRNTRASSMEHDNFMSNESELTHTPIKSRKRASMIPSEATVIEEKEESMKVLRVSLNRTSPNTSKELKNSPKVEEKRNSISDLENKINGDSCKEKDEKDGEKNTSVKEVQNNPAETTPSKSLEDVEKDVSANDSNIMQSDDKTISDESENLLTQTLTEKESLKHDVSRTISQEIGQNIYKEVEIKLEKLVSNSVEKDGDLSNKENHHLNVINEEPSMEDTVTNTPLQSPKPLSISNTNKLTNQRSKSPANSSPRSRHSRSSETVDDTNVSVKEVCGNDDLPDNLEIEQMDALEHAELSDSYDNVPKSIVETDSLNEIMPTESLDKSLSIKVNSDSSSDGTIEVIKADYTENLEEISATSNDDIDFRNEEFDEGCMMDVTVVKVEQTTDTGKDSVKDSTEQNKDDTKEKANKSCALEDVQNSSSSLTNVPLKSPEIISIEETESSIILEDKVSEPKSTNKMDTSSSEISTATKPLDDQTNTKSPIILESKETSELKDTSETNIESSSILESKETSELKDTSETNIEPSSILEIKDSSEPKDTNKTNTSSFNTSIVIEPSDGNANIESLTVPEIKETSEPKDTNKTNTSSPNKRTVVKSFDDPVDPKDSVTSNADGNNVTNLVKTGPSSIVTEAPVVLNEELEEEEQSRNMSATNDHSTSKDESMEKLELSEKKSESTQEENNMNQQNMDVDGGELDENAENLFHDISADEWKRKSADIEKCSIHSTSTDKLDIEPEVEAECDLVLVDKEAWLAAESMKAEKEKQVFDYESDDTVILKMKKDTAEARKNEEMEMDVSLDKSIKTKRKSLKQDEKAEEENAKENIEACNSDTEGQNKSIEDSNDEHSTSKHNVSIEKSKAKESFSESKKILQAEENTSLNMSKKRKSLNKSVCERNDELETSNKIESVKTKTPLDKFVRKQKQIAETETSNDSVIITSTKKMKKKRSLNNSSKDTSVTEESKNKSELQTSAAKKKLAKHISRISTIELDSDTTKSSSDSQDEITELPRFLLGEGSNSDGDGESSKSINSDIEREYNLGGKDITKFDDDDVPGDECRASETESSDPDDHGSDLADFVVDDDEVEEEDDSDVVEVGKLNDEDDEEDEKDEEEMEVEIMNEPKEGKETGEEDKENDVKQKNDTIELDNTMDTSAKDKRKSKKSLSLSKSQIIEADISTKKSKKANTSQAEKSEKEHSFSDVSSLNSSKTKKAKQKRVSGEFVVTEVEAPSNESQLVFNKKMEKFEKLINCSTPKSHLYKTKELNISNIETSSIRLSNENTKLKADTSFGKLKKLKGRENLAHRHSSSEISELAGKTNIPKSLQAKVAAQNKTTLILSSDTPTTKHLRKEKLSESAPIIQLSDTYEKFVDDNSNEQNELNQLEENDNVADVETAKELTSSLKEMKESGRRKKNKKRKVQAEQANNSGISTKQSFHEDADSQIKDENQKSSTVTNDEKVQLEEASLDEEKKKKKKKKKKGTVQADINKDVEEASPEAINDAKPETTKKSKKAKKKQEQELIENVPDISENQASGKETKKANKEPMDTDIPKKKQKLVSNDNSQNIDEPVGKSSKKKKKSQLENSEEVPAKEQFKKKQDSSPVNENVSSEEPSKKNKKSSMKGKNNKEKISKPTSDRLQESVVILDPEEGQMIDQFSEAREEAVRVIKRTADNIKSNKEAKKKKQKKHSEVEEDVKNEERKVKKQEVKANKTNVEKKGIKRLSDEVLQNLSDIPMVPSKKRKLLKTAEQTVPSRSMFDVKEVKNVYVEETDFIPLSCNGATTQFAVTNLQKMKKKRKIQAQGVVTFKQKMFARNSRQPVSAYLTYLEKQKASGKNKYFNN